MQKAISLLGPDNGDLARANAELDDIKAKLPKSTPAPEPTDNEATTLTEPSPLPSPLDGGPIDLP